MNFMKRENRMITECPAIGIKSMICKIKYFFLIIIFREKYIFCEREFILLKEKNSLSFEREFFVILEGFERGIVLKNASFAS